MFKRIFFITTMFLSQQLYSMNQEESKFAKTVTEFEQIITKLKNISVLIKENKEEKNKFTLIQCTTIVNEIFMKMKTIGTNLLDPKFDASNINQNFINIFSIQGQEEIFKNLYHLYETALENQNTESINARSFEGMNITMLYLRSLTRKIKPSITRLLLDPLFNSKDDKPVKIIKKLKNYTKINEELIKYQNILDVQLHFLLNPTAAEAISNEKNGVYDTIEAILFASN